MKFDIHFEIIYTSRLMCYNRVYDRCCLETVVLTLHPVKSSVVPILPY